MEKTIFEQFKNSTQGIEITKQEGTFSLLHYVGCLGGCFAPYSSKYYDFDFNNLVFFSEGKHGLLLFDLNKYILTTRTTFYKFMESAGNISEINDFNLIWKETENLYKDNLSKNITLLNEKDLDFLINKLFNLYHSLLASTVFSESLDESQVKEYYREINSGIEGFDEFFGFASKPTFESFVLRIDQALVNKDKTVDELQYLFSDYYITPESKLVKEKIAELILQRGGEQKILEEIDSIKSELSKNAEIISKFRTNLSVKNNLLFDFVQKSMYIRDIRKEALQKQLAMISNTVRQIFIQIGINPEDAPYAIYSDFDKGFYQTSKYGKEITDRKQQGFVAIFNANGNRFEYGDVATKKKQFFDLIDKSSSEHIELRGNVAYKGLVKAKAQIILSEKDFSKFKDGNVLVTSMTRPEFVPIMKRASAVVTDEGGITCHAAIVSRELKIPCITGTKNATRLLKDNTMIEVDANTGIVKLI